MSWVVLYATTNPLQPVLLLMRLTSKEFQYCDKATDPNRYDDSIHSFSFVSSTDKHTRSFAGNESGNNIIDIIIDPSTSHHLIGHIQPHGNAHLIRVHPWCSTATKSPTTLSLQLKYTNMATTCYTKSSQLAIMVPNDV